MSYKTVTQESYQATAEAYTHNVADLAPLESIEKFVKLLPAKAKIIDLGCGSGRDAKIFTDKGISVLGIDFSPNLLAIAKAKAPLAEFKEMDIENATFPAASFDGAWACCSFSHIPKKNVPSVLKNIHFSLKDKGYLYLALKKGLGEGVEKDLRYGNFEKFWSFFEENEIKEVLQLAKFKILECSTVEKQFAYQTGPALRLFCQKN